MFKIDGYKVKVLSHALGHDDAYGGTILGTDVLGIEGRATATATATITRQRPRGPRNRRRARPRRRDRARGGCVS